MPKKTLLHRFSKHETGLTVGTVLLVTVAVVSAALLFVLYKYWFPPVLVFRNGDLGKVVTMQTNLGTIEIALDPRPKFTNAQFTRLVRNGFYDGTRFHRIVPNLFIEGGDPLTKSTDLRQLWGEGGSASAFKNETYFDDKMTRGVVAMSGSGAGTYGSHFFILTKDTSWLKGSHTIIGHVTSGMDIVDKIGNLPRSVIDAPLQDVVVYRITVL